MEIIFEHEIPLDERTINALLCAGEIKQSVRTYNSNLKLKVSISNDNGYYDISARLEKDSDQITKDDLGAKIITIVESYRDLINPPL